MLFLFFKLLFTLGHVEGSLVLLIANSWTFICNHVQIIIRYWLLMYNYVHFISNELRMCRINLEREIYAPQAKSYVELIGRKIQMKMFYLCLSPDVIERRQIKASHNKGAIHCIQPMVIVRKWPVSTQRVFSKFFCSILIFWCFAFNKILLQCSTYDFDHGSNWYIHRMLISSQK